MEGRIEFALALWEAAKPFALACCAGALIGLLLFSLARGVIMAEVKTEPVKATLFDDIDSVEATPGAFEYYREGDRYPAGMIYCCPCGCKATGALAFRPHASPSWDWDGNMEAPTLSPSVHHVGHWHGYLRAGIWESC